MNTSFRSERAAFITGSFALKFKELSKFSKSRGNFLTLIGPACHSSAIPFFLCATSQKRKDEQKVSALRIISDETVRTKSSLPEDCEQRVSVTIKLEDLGGRQRRISGSILIPALSERVWNVITAYDKIEAYMPNIVSSTVERLNGQIFLDQIGVISRRLRIRTRMLLRVEEDLDHKTISFVRVEGRDFQEFVGLYTINDFDENTVRLEYEVVAIPFPLYPMSLVEKKAYKEIPRMLASIRDEVVLGRHVRIQ